MNTFYRFLWRMIGVRSRVGEVWAVSPSFFLRSMTAGNLGEAAVGLVVGEPVWREDELESSWFRRMFDALFLPLWHVCHPVSIDGGPVELIPESWLRKCSVRLG